MARRADFRRIGLLLPSSNSVQEGDFWRALPPGFTLHVTRMGLSMVEADSTLRIAQEIEIESKKMLRAPPLSGIGILLSEHLDDAAVTRLDRMVG